MFGFVTNFVVEIIFSIAILYGVYEILISDLIKSWRQSRQDQSDKISNADKLAQVKMSSNSEKEIEAFINANVQYLSHRTIAKLVERIELIKANQVIAQDNSNLMLKIDALDSKKK